MKGQKGQSVVEFALIVPLLLMVIIGMIYGAFIYSDYLQYSTAVRDAARDIAVQNTDERSRLIAKLDDDNDDVVKNYVTPFLLNKYYDVDFSVRTKDGYVQVMVVFTRPDDDEDSIRVLPRNLAALQCTMPLEKEIYTGETEEN